MRNRVERHCRTGAMGLVLALLIGCASGGPIPADERASSGRVVDCGALGSAPGPSYTQNLLSPAQTVGSPNAYEFGEGTEVARGAAAGAPSYAQLILEMDQLAGTQLRLQPAQPMDIEPADWDARAWATSGDARRFVTCDLAAIAALMLAMAEEPSGLRRDLSLFRTNSYIGPGRYDFGRSLYAVAEANSAQSLEAIDDEVGLGSANVEMALERMTTFIERPLNEDALEVSFTIDGGGFRYLNQRVRLDVGALRLVLVADRLFYRQTMLPFEACFGAQPTNARLSRTEQTFCANLRTRLGTTPERRTETISTELRRDRTVGDILREWRSAYGGEAVQAYLEEVWSLLRAAAEHYAAPGTRQCSGEGCDELARMGAPAFGAMNAIQLVLGHEISHHALRHTHDLLPVNASADETCRARQALEIEADIAAAALLRSVQERTARTDYFGTPIASTDLGSVMMSRAVFTNWMPFFGGVAEYYEGEIGSCAYPLAKSRHVLFQVIYTLRDDLSPQM